MLGQPENKQGDVATGWYYNEDYMNNSLAIEDARCGTCPFYPRCGYAICVGLHGLVGNDKVCKFYDLQMKRAKDHVTKFIKEVNKNDKSN